MKGALSEVSFYGTDEETGINVRVRPDFLNISENIGVNAVISLKTTSSDTIEMFARDCTKYMYQLSEGMYQEVISSVTGRKFNVTIMIMFQTVPPYDVALLWWQPDDLNHGKYLYHYALSIVRECNDCNSYPGFDALAEQDSYGLIDFLLPDYAKKVMRPISITN